MAAATPCESASEPAKKLPLPESFSLLAAGGAPVAHPAFSDAALLAQMAPPVVPLPPNHRAGARGPCAPNESRKAASWNHTAGAARSSSSRSRASEAGAAAQSLPFPVPASTSVDLDERCDDVTSREDYALTFPLQALPDELLAHCLARVSGSHAGPGCVLLRGVCRRWRRILRSPAFLDLRSSIGQTQEWLVTLTCRTAGGLLCKLFDPLTNKCQRLHCSLASLPPERRHYGATSIGREIFIIGGELAVQDEGGAETGVRYLDAAEAYDSVLDASRKLPPLPGGGRSRFACCSGDGRVYVLGGVGANGRPVLSCSVYDNKEGAWHAAAPLPQSRVGAQAKFCGGRVVLVGGREDSSEASSPLRSVEALDPVLNRWVPLPPLPFPRADFQTAILRDQLCVVGGERPLGEEEGLDLEEGLEGEGNGLAGDGDGFGGVPNGWGGGVGGPHQDMNGDLTVACFGAPLLFDHQALEWKAWRPGLGFRSLLGPAPVPGTGGRQDQGPGQDQGQDQGQGQGQVQGQGQGQGGGQGMLRTECHHPACLGYQSRSYAVLAVYNCLYLVRRCDKGKSSYCRHIHKFLPFAAGGGGAWECIHRRKAFSSLLREAGDCWAHSIVEVILC